MNKKEVKTTSKKLVQDLGDYSGWKDRVCPSAIEFEKNTFVLEQAKCTIYSIFNYPSQAGMLWLRPLITMPNTMISIYNEQADKSELLKSIDFTIREQQVKQAEKIESELRLAQDAADKIDKAMNLSQRIMSDNVNVDRITIYIMAFAEDDVELKKICQDIEGKLSAYRFTCRRFPYLQADGFDAMNPVCDNKYRANTSIMMPSDVFWAGLGIVPSFGINDPTGLFLGWDETANPIFMDIWQKSHNKTNYNLAVMGRSGSGKSATGKNLIAHELTFGTKMYILDPEEEYLSLAKQFGGNIINASGGINSDGERSIINPLQLTDFPETWDDLSPEKIEELSKENNFQGSVSQKITQLKKWFKIYIPDFTMAHISLLETALYEMYRRKGLVESTDPRLLSNLDNPIMSDLGDVLIDFERREEDKQKKQLYSEILVFLESALHGTDRFLFNGHTNVDLKNSLNVFNVKALLTAPDNIKNAQFSNITSFVWLELTKNKFERTVLQVDEAHLFINKNSTATFEFLGQLCKRARKYSSGLWITTQNPSDFLHEEVALYGEGILNNCASLLLMKASATDLQKLTHLYDLNAGEQERIKNASIGQGLLMAGDMRVFANIKLNDMILDIAKTGGGV